MRKFCPKCNAEYELIEIPISVRDKDSLECDFCSTTFFKWNGASFFTIKEVISKPKNYKANSQK